MRTVGNSLGRAALVLLLLSGPALVTLPAEAEPVAFKVLPNYSRATFKTDAPLETIVGTTAGPGVSGAITLDLARPETVRGVIKVDLTTVNSGVAKRDADMKGPDYLDAANEANRYAVFEIRGAEILGLLEPGKDTPAKVKGILTIKGKPVETIVDARITHVKLKPAELETVKRFGYTEDVIRVRAKFQTAFTNHGMQIPQLLTLKVSNRIELETDLTFVRQ